MAFDRELAAHGRKVSGAGLAGPDTATTLRTADGHVQVTDVPFVELAEHIGGYYDIEAPDLDTVIRICRELPSTYTIEIRPVMVFES